MRLRALVLLLLLAPPLAQGEEADDVERALAWLGGLAGNGIAAPDAPYFVESAAQAGHDPKTWPRADASAFAALRPYGSADPTLAYNGDLRITYAAATSGYDPRDVNGIDYVARVRAGFQGAQFGNPGTLNDDAWAILALRAAGVPASDPQIRAAVTVLRSSQRLDGGWTYNTGGLASSTDVTGMVLAALRSAGEDLAGESEARAFLDSTHKIGGGHSDFPGGSASTQSSIWAIAGYSALGLRASEGTDAFIRARQQDDGGFAARENAGSDALATREAIPYIAGAIHPFRGYASATIREPECHALEPATLRAAAPFSSLRVTWEDGAAGATRALPRAGEHPYRYHATGPGIVARGEGVLACLSARPVVPAFSGDVRLPRHTPVVLDVSGARDPDGAIAAWEVDWGDGNVTNTTTHAYALPGAYAITARAQDDSGVWSAPVKLNATVENRAPRLSVPARIASDRVAGFEVAPVAADDDGDALDLSWRFGDASGAGAPKLVPRALGNHTLEVFARDAFGGVANASVVVEVVNAPPTLALAQRGDEVVADARDPDGPAPSVAWLVDGVPRAAPIRLGEGTFRVVATATDADGATADAAITVTREAEAPASPPVAPEVVAFDARLANGTLRVAFELAPADATARLVWRSDAGEGAAVVASPFEVALPGATWASALLVAERDGLQATRDSGLLVPPAAAPAPSLAPAPPSPVVVAAAPPVPPPSPAREDPIEPASLNLQGARRETPAPSLALVLAFALALGMPRRRAR